MNQTPPRIVEKAKKSQGGGTDKSGDPDRQNMPRHDVQYYQKYERRRAAELERYRLRRKAYEEREPAAVLWETAVKACVTAYHEAGGDSAEKEYELRSRLCWFRQLLLDEIERPSNLKPSHASHDKARVVHDNQARLETLEPTLEPEKESTDDDETIEEMVLRMERELDAEFAFLRPAAARTIAATEEVPEQRVPPAVGEAEEVPDQRVPPAVGEEMEAASGWHQTMLDAAGYDQPGIEEEIQFEVKLHEKVSSLSLPPPAETATTMAAAAPRAAAPATPETTTATPAVPPDPTATPTGVPTTTPAATATATPAPTAAATTEAAATVVAATAVAAEPTASPLPAEVPPKEPSESPTGTHGTMLPAEAPPKMPPEPTINAETWKLEEMAEEQPNWGQKPDLKSNRHGKIVAAAREKPRGETNQRPPDIAPAVRPPPDRDRFEWRYMYQLKGCHRRRMNQSTSAKGVLDIGYLRPRPRVRGRIPIEDWYPPTGTQRTRRHGGSAFGRPAQ
jgi:hypothetical protein